MKKLLIVGVIGGTSYFALNVRAVDFMSPACRAEAEAVQQLGEQVDHDLLVIRDTYTVTGRAPPGALNEVKQRQDRLLVDLDAFERRCK